MKRTKSQIESVVDDIHRQLISYVLDEGRIAVVKAPPGSGKTYLLMKVVEAAKKMRVAIATQTRSQADDICHRLVTHFKITPIRFAAASSARTAQGYPVLTDKNDLPKGRCVV